MPAAQASAEQISYVVQTYVKGARGALRPGEQLPCRNEAHARVRADRLMAAGRILGVDVVRQTADLEAGEYGEPEYLARIGQVPELG
jgi:hypothetical protein